MSYTTYIIYIPGVCQAPDRKETKIKSHKPPWRGLTKQGGERSQANSLRLCSLNESWTHVSFHHLMVWDALIKVRWSYTPHCPASLGWPKSKQQQGLKEKANFKSSTWELHWSESQTRKIQIGRKNRTPKGKVSCSESLWWRENATHTWDGPV